MLAAVAEVVDFPDAEAREALEDARAVEAAARGDRRAFERLYRRHVGRIHALCLRLAGHRETAEDCVQETFVSAWRALPAFEARSRFSTWLHRIAVNSVLARQRGLAARLESTTDAAAETLDRRAVEDTPPLDIETAIATLPEGARHVLVLVGLYGFSHEQAAAELGIAVGTSKAQLHRARQILSDRLGLEGEVP
ncbi:MAG TPA: sigma-70 family RNA polymerase sigma factor [Steroidobacteraceae bacterium]|nr:sigma-70 family RNA polymerase sigma factor [Steroidobacteraceae bacterium]